MENQQEIIQKIQSEQPELLTSAIQEIKENGDLSMAKLLLETLPAIQDFHTKTMLLHLLADIKENAFKEIVIQQIKATIHTPEVQTDLLRIVWESSLNYSDYLPLFLDIIQNGEFTVAFEASTIIENMLHQLTSEQLHQLNHFIETFSAEKQFLVENIQTEITSCEND